MGHEISIAYPLQRIVSLVPSQTELLFDLELSDQIAGITKFCIHPSGQVKTKVRIGGTKKLCLEKIMQLQPGLIIGNKEENEEGQIRELMKEYPVWMSDIKSLEDALEMIRAVGNLTGKIQKAVKLAEEIGIRFSRLEKMPFHRAVYLIWKDPYMAAGQNTFINDMLRRCGLENVADADRYPQFSVNELKTLNPGLILLSSEPYPFREKHIRELKEICPDATVKIVDGELFSWYGSRLLHTPAYFQKLAAEW